MSTVFPTTAEANAQRAWKLIDADGQVVGRLASEIAQILRGKNKASFTPHNDCGDFVVVVNAEKIRFTGNKWDDKVYQWHSGYVGGLKSETAKERLEKHPEEVLVGAVRGMLPKTPLGRQQLKKLKVYAGPDHPHAPQNPEVVQ